MVPWNKIPKDLQQAILTMIVVLGGTSLSCRLGPTICDPPPPPATTPMICDPPPPPMTPTPSRTPTFTPTICDPSPPPAMTSTPSQTSTFTPTPPGPATPMICDPAPPPTFTPTPPGPATPMICDPPPPPPTVASTRRFSGAVVGRTEDSNLAGASILGLALDSSGQPLAGLPLRLTCQECSQGSGWQAETVSDQAGAFSFFVTEAGIYILTIQEDSNSANALVMELKQHTILTVQWTEQPEQSQLPLDEIRPGQASTSSARLPQLPLDEIRPGQASTELQPALPQLPLGEIRLVTIVRQGGLTFTAETPWPNARYRWSVTGGELVPTDQGVFWQPPAEPGRYLLQLVADWGIIGLAVDSLVLTVA